MLPSAAASVAQRRRSSWLDEASANRTFGVRRRASARPRPRQRGHHPGARPRRARDRDRRPARPRDVLGAHEVPGRRPAGARRARRVKADESSTEAHRAEQAEQPRRGRDDPREERRPRHLAPRPPRRGRLVSDSAKALKQDMLRAAGVETVAEEAAPRSRRPSHPTERRVVPQSVISRQRPTPSWYPTSPPPGSAGPAPAGWPPGVARPAVPVVRVRRRVLVHEPARAHGVAGPRRPRADAAPGAGRRRRQGRSPDLPAGRRARPGQDRAGAAGRRGGERLSALGRRTQRRQDQLGARGGHLDPQAPRHRHPRRRPHDRRLRRHRGRQLRGARPARRLARRLRVPRHGRRRGPLHQEQELCSARGTRSSSPSASAPAPCVRSDGADRHPADQRHRGLPGDPGSSSAGSTTRSRSAS